MDTAKSFMSTEEIILEILQVERNVFHTSFLAGQQGIEDMKSLIKISQRIFLSTLIAKLTKSEKPLHN